MASFPTFPFAEQADILRSVQKDEHYQRIVNNQLFDLVRQLAGPRVAMQHKEEVTMAADLVYHSLTTASGNQTLGEEYCDIIQVDDTATTITPTTSLQRMLFVLWHVLIPYLSSILVRKLRKLSNPSPPVLGTRESESWFKFPRLTPSQQEFLKKFLPYAIDFTNILHRVHIAFFYFNGVFYHLSRRLVNQRYGSDQPTYGFLGLLIFAQLSISLVLFLKRAINQYSGTSSIKVNIEADKSNGYVTTKNDCSLCLNRLVNPTSTSCGHIFCWHCIAEWCNTKPECPLCRTPQQQNRLVPVYGI